MFPVLHAVSAVAAIRVAIAIVLATLAFPVAGLAQTVLFESDFEAPIYGLGPVGETLGAPNSGQDGWRAQPREPYSAAPSPWVTVSDARATSGNQSLRLAMDNSYFNGVNAYGVNAVRDFSSQPIALNSQTNAFSVSMNLYLDELPTSDLSWTLSMLTGSIGALGVTLLPGNQVSYGHHLMSQPAVFAPGFDLFNTWLQVTLERHPVDYTTLRLSIGNGSQLWQQQVQSPGGAMPFVAFGGNMPTFPTASSRGIAYIDDFRIGYNLNPIPEPGTGVLAMFGLGILAASNRRGAGRQAGADGGGR